MIEKIARAVFQRHEDADPWVSEQRRHLPKRTWENIEECERRSYLLDAHFTLQVMREPTEQMLAGAWVAAHDADAAATWRAMIDAALNEELNKCLRCFEEPDK
jgi:hypothetical protein